MALKPFNTLAGYSVGNTGATTVIDSVGNVSANFLAVTSNSNLGNYATANFFTGDGGLLTNISATTSNAIANGTSNVRIPAASGNINLSVGGNSNVLVVTGTGINVAGTLNATGNANTGNIGATTGVFTNISGTLTGTLANGTSNVAIPTASGNVNITAGGTTTLVVTSTSVNVAGILNATGNIIASSLYPISNNSGELGNSAFRWGSAYITAPTVQSMTATNRIALSSNAELRLGSSVDNNAAMYYNTGNGLFELRMGPTSANFQITNNGTPGFTFDRATSNLTTTGNITATGNIAGNVFIGNGSQLTGISATILANGTSNVNIPAASGNVNISVGGTSNVLVVTTTGANITGTLGTSGNTTVSNLIANTNIFTPSITTTTANGNLTIDPNGSGNLVVSPTTPMVISNSGVANTAGALLLSGNLTSASGNVGLLHIGNPASWNSTDVPLWINGSANGTININFDNSNTGNAAAITTSMNLGDATNYYFYKTLSKTGAFIGTGESLYLSAGENGLTGNLDFYAHDNISFDFNNTPTPIIFYGSNGTARFLYTVLVDGTVNAASYSNGNSNIRVLTNSNVVISAAGSANILTVTGTGVNVAGTLNTGTGNANVGNLGTAGNITAGYYFGNGSQLTGISATTASALANGTSNVSIPASGGNVNTSVGGVSNVLVVTTTGANITGTLNATGNANTGNIGATNGVFTNISGTLTGSLANGTSNVAIPTASGNVNITAGGTTTLVVTSTGANITGTLETSGNTTVSNLIANTNIFTPSITTSATNGNLTIDPNGSGNLVISSTTPTVLANSGTTTSPALQLTGSLSTSANYGLLHIGTQAATTNANVPLWINQSANAKISTFFTNPNTQSNAGISYDMELGGALPSDYSYISLTRNNFSIETSNNLNLTSGLGGGGIVGNMYLRSWNDVTITAGDRGVTGTGNIVFGTVSYSSQVRLLGDANGTMEVNGYANFFNPVRVNALFTATNISTGTLANSTSNIRIFSAGNVTTSVGGTSNVLVVTSTGANITGTLNTGTGNANVGNLGTAGLILASGNITGANIISNNTVFAANIQAVPVVGPATNFNILGSIAPSTANASGYPTNIYGGTSNNAGKGGALTLNGGSVGNSSSTAGGGDVYVQGQTGGLLGTGGNIYLIAGGEDPVFHNGAYAIFYGSSSGVNGNAEIYGGGANGTNIVGGSTIIAGGKSTGNANAGVLLFQTSTTGASGTTPQTYANRVVINSTTVNITTSTNSTSTTSGGLVVAGGVGISGNLYAGGIANITGNANVGNIGATNGVFTNISGTLTGTLANGTSNINIVNNANINMVRSGTTRLVVTNTGVNVTGAFSATSKSFLIQHPINPEMYLQYGSLESPYHGVRLTGEAIVKKGKCVIILPDYIKGLVKQEGAQVQLTNYQHGRTLYVDSINVDDNMFVVKSNWKLGELKFFWSFTGIRKDVDDLVVEY